MKNIAKRILLVLLACTVFQAPDASAGGRGPRVRLLYWNIQNGMWSGQGDNYDRFVEWVKSFDADICVWCEAQSIYRTGTVDKLPADERYLVDNWGKLAARYGHRYWYVGGHRDSYPQVITSKYPIENVERIIGIEPDSVVSHGAGWARIRRSGRTLNIVPLHLWPQQFAYRASDREASRARHEGDLYRRREIEYICRHTVATHPAAAGELWVMLGDFNSRSRRDNAVYGYADDDTRLLVHDYIAAATPYVDIIAERFPDTFCTTTAGRSRIDFVYCTPTLWQCVAEARVVADEYTEPVRDSGGRSNF